MNKKNKHTSELNNKEKHKKRKMKKSVWSLIIIGALLVVIFSGIGIYKWFKDNKISSEIVEQIENTTNIEEIPASDADEIVTEPADKSDPYWDYINLPLISVDFNELLKTNNETVAFIKVNNTNINYPVVQTTDNDYYLTHDFNKNKNGGGWVYSDYRNSINNLKDNTVIYAHGRQNNTMFGSLKNVLNESWYQDNSNTVINISTPQENTMWQIFSIYTIPTETYYLTTSFGTTESHQEFIDTIMSRSVYDFKTTVSTTDRILTLSTCLNDDVKIVLHAKLIKKQSR